MFVPLNTSKWGGQPNQSCGESAPRGLHKGGMAPILAPFSIAAPEYPGHALQEGLKVPMDIPHIQGGSEICSLQLCPIGISSKRDSKEADLPGSAVLGVPMGKNAHLEVAPNETAGADIDLST